MPCKHAELAAIYAQQMAEMDEPWKLWIGIDHNGIEFPLCSHPQWNDNYQYKQIPKTIKIGVHVVPEPMREKPDFGHKFYFVDPETNEGINCDIWNNCDLDKIKFDRGICHTTKEAAIAHAKALFSFSEVG